MQDALDAFGRAARRDDRQAQAIVGEQPLGERLNSCWGDLVQLGQRLVERQHTLVQRLLDAQPCRQMAALLKAQLHPTTRVCARAVRSEEHTSELQSRLHLVCRLLLEK